MVIDLK